MKRDILCLSAKQKFEVSSTLQLAAKKQLTKLKIYSGSNHPHESQNPEFIDLKKLNKKNIIKN